MKHLLFFLFAAQTAAFNLMAQTIPAPEQTKSALVVATRTDAAYANKTTVYTKTGVSDAKVLAAISDDYSLGDEVRITTETPPPLVPEKVEVPLIKRVIVESPSPKVAPSVISLEQAFTKPSADLVLTKGTIVRTQNLRFASDATQLDASSHPFLDDIFKYLTEHPLVILEVGGHTNMLPSHEYCVTLSEARAKAIVGYLTAKGIASNRLRPRGYGKTQPLIATTSETANQANQRVELKVLQNN